MAAPNPGPLTLNWAKCEGDIWCSLYFLNLSQPSVKGRGGVYVIWLNETVGLQTRTPCIYVGQTDDFGRRFGEHKSSPEISQYINSGVLHVTRAEVFEIYRDGVEWFLALKLNPREGFERSET